MPYAPKTTQVKIVGLKRTELNRPLKFPGIDEESFDSVFRRCLIIKMKSKFINRQRHRAQVGDRAMDWVSSPASQTSRDFSPAAPPFSRA